MGRSLPSFFLMKKHDAVYRDLDGRMVPLPRCSLTNLHSSASSGCDSGMSFPGSDAGAPGLSSIAWSQMHDGGNLCDASLLNTSAKINFSYSILFHLTTSYSSYFEGKKGISRNKTSFFLLMNVGIPEEIRARVWHLP